MLIQRQVLKNNFTFVSDEIFSQEFAEEFQDNLLVHFSCPHKTLFLDTAKIRSDRTSLNSIVSSL